MGKLNAANPENAGRHFQGLTQLRQGGAHGKAQCVFAGQGGSWRDWRAWKGFLCHGNSGLGKNPSGN